MDIMQLALNQGHCTECPKMELIHQQTDDTPAEYQCPAMSDDKDCYAYDKIISE